LRCCHGAKHFAESRLKLIGVWSYPPYSSTQGRARPTLAKLYNWRYRDLGDLPLVSQAPAFVAANPGFALDFQLIDVPDFNGRGESSPLPYFYQV
jgi:intron-binding protein aquarius